MAKLDSRRGSRVAKKTVVSLAALALTLTACDGGNGEEAPAPGAEGGGGAGSMVMSSFGGDTDDFLQQSVHTYLDEYGDVEPTLDAADAATRTTQLITESEAEEGTWDLIALTDRDVPDLAEEGLLQEIDPELISNYEHIQEGLLNDYCVPQFASPLTIIYNADEVDIDATSWEAAFSDEFLEVAGINPIWSDYLFFGAAILEAGGDPGSDLSPGYDRVAEIASEPQSYGSPTQLGQGLMTGEVQATVGPRARGAQWASESGRPFETVVPDEGTFNSVFYYCIPANAQNPEAAHDYLDAVLDPRGQEFFAENFFYAPSVTNVELDPELEEQVGITDDEAARTWTPDMGEVSEQSSEFREIWNENS